MLGQAERMPSKLGLASWGQVMEAVLPMSAMKGDEKWETHVGGERRKNRSEGEKGRVATVQRPANFSLLGEKKKIRGLPRYHHLVATAQHKCL